MIGSEVIRRSCMVSPGSNEKMLIKAAGLQTDAVVLDLEDSVAHGQKAAARAIMRKSVVELDWGSKELSVRVNSLHTPFFLDDILALRDLPIQSVVLPKTQSYTDIVVLAVLLDQIDPGKKISIQPLIETARGLNEVEAVCKANPRVSAVIFGAGDFSVDVGCAWNVMSLIYARSRISVAASAAGIQAIDLVYPNFKDVDKIKADTQLGKDLGYDGKWAIHPIQVEVINQVYTPSEKEIQKAKEIISVYDKAVSEGTGSISVNNEMIDEASVKIWRRKAALAKKLGLWD